MTASNVRIIRFVAVQTIGFVGHAIGNGVPGHPGLALEGKLGSAAQPAGVGEPMRGRPVPADGGKGRFRLGRHSRAWWRCGRIEERPECRARRVLSENLGARSIAEPRRGEPEQHRRPDDDRRGLGLAHAAPTAQLRTPAARRRKTVGYRVSKHVEAEAEERGRVHLQRGGASVSAVVEPRRVAVEPILATTPPHRRLPFGRGLESPATARPSRPMNRRPLARLTSNTSEWRCA